ncbi:MAG: hypothetical protein O6952_09835 [Planctomycetota bacterium]|nr:hypothetical protein [Planctomycetota bacterium]
MTALAGAATVLWMTGCASLMSGTTQKVNVSTSPVRGHLKVRYGGTLIYEGSAPWKSDTARKRFDLTVEVTAPGYHTEKRKFEKRVTLWYRANLLFLGLFNNVDKNNGALWVIKEPNMHITMRPMEGGPSLCRAGGGGDRDGPSRDKPRPRPKRKITSKDIVWEDSYDN